MCSHKYHQPVAESNYEIRGIITYRGYRRHGIAYPWPTPSNQIRWSSPPDHQQYNLLSKQLQEE